MSGPYDSTRASRPVQCMTPERLRAWAIVIMRDILSPATGLLTTLYLAVSHQLQTFDVPLILSLVGVPLVGRAMFKDDEHEDDE